MPYVLLVRHPPGLKAVACLFKPPSSHGSMGRTSLNPHHIGTLEDNFGRVSAALPTPFPRKTSTFSSIEPCSVRLGRHTSVFSNRSSGLGGDGKAEATYAS